MSRRPVGAAGVGVGVGRAAEQDLGELGGARARFVEQGHLRWTEVVDDRLYASGDVDAAAVVCELDSVAERA